MSNDESLDIMLAGGGNIFDQFTNAIEEAKFKTGESYYLRNLLVKINLVKRGLCRTPIISGFNC
ncbi:MAG: hypothetical protein RI575_11065 [Balneolaceae bacterium]|nr:hypothetical protein [Balneolaceae bacterium]MDR9410345.1 hypothetical protein [Balneolaceae bacterium]